MTPKHSFDAGGPDSAAILRYVSGESPLPEAEAIRAWLAGDPSRQASIEEVRRAWTVPAPQVPAWDRDGVWSTIANELRTGGDRTDRTGVVRRADPAGLTSLRRSDASVSTTVSRRWLPVALGAAAVLVVGVALRARSHAAVRPAHTYVTAARERLDVVLPDGSHAILAPQTTLTVSRGYGVETRDVALMGQVQFDIATQERAPFVVHQGALAVRVLGTRFDVRHYPEDAATQVFVAAGKVAVDGGHLSRTLTAGMAGWFTDSTARTQTVSDTTGYTDWTRGQLVFHNVPASSILRTLGRWYGLDFRVTDSTLATKQFTATFQMDAPSETMRLLTQLLHVSVAMQDTVVILSPAQTVQRSKSRQHQDVIPFASEVGR